MPLPRRIAGGVMATAFLVVLTACSGSTSGDESAATSSSTEAPASTTTSFPASDPRSVPADPSAGCGVEPDVEPIAAEAPGDVELTFPSGGRDRVYRLAIPADYDPDTAAPLVMNVHGSGSTAVEASLYTGLPKAGTDRGMIVVAPEGTDGQWELGSDGVDHDFLTGLIDDLESRFCVDRNRVHAVGMSLGAWKAAATACGSPGRFASLSLVTVEVRPPGCEPLPVVAFHGTADPVVAYGEGGGTVDSSATPNAGLPPTLDNMVAWAEGAGCATEPEPTPIGDDVEHRVYDGCDDDLGVELYTVVGGGHTWPGAEIEIGPTTDTIDATGITLDWFEAHPRR